MNDARSEVCPECGSNPLDRGESASRRAFLKTIGLSAAGLTLSGRGWVEAATITPFGRIEPPQVGPSPTSAAESAAARLFASLDSEQKGILHLPFSSPLRRRINANWAVTRLTIDDLTTEQQALAREAVRAVMSPDGYERMLKQMEEDYGGLGSYHLAFFGQPWGQAKTEEEASEGFEFVLTGRHVTLRADGNTNPGVAFGGPIVYGHGAGDGEAGLPGNVYYNQTRTANQVFQALDGKQRKAALLPKAPAETSVKVQGDHGSFPGLAVGELSSDQKELFRSVLKTLLAPYREEDQTEAMALIEAQGGLDRLHIAFYETGDLGNDREWDIWRIEGPSAVFHFRGSPHVHAYINVAKNA